MLAKIGDTLVLVDAVTVIGPVLKLEQWDAGLSKAKSKSMFGIICGGAAVKIEFENDAVAEMARDLLIEKWKRVNNVEVEEPAKESDAATSPSDTVSA